MRNFEASLPLSLFTRTVPRHPIVVILVHPRLRSTFLASPPLPHSIAQHYSIRSVSPSWLLTTTHPLAACAAASSVSDTSHVPSAPPLPLSCSAQQYHYSTNTPPATPLAFELHITLYPATLSALQRLATLTPTTTATPPFNHHFASVLAHLSSTPSHPNAKTNITLATPHHRPI